MIIEYDPEDDTMMLNELYQLEFDEVILLQNGVPVYSRKFAQVVLNYGDAAGIQIELEIDTPACPRSGYAN